MGCGATEAQGFSGFPSTLRGLPLRGLVEGKKPRVSHLRPLLWAAPFPRAWSGAPGLS